MPRDRAAVWTILAVAGLLATYATVLVLTARAQSATMDEQVHIARGLSYLRTGDLRLIREHPPLIGLVSALPLAADRDVKMPRSSWEAASVYQFADDLLWRVNPDGPAIVQRARMPIVALALLLGLVVFGWARELAGRAAGVLALALVTLDPNLIAHGCLATNDLGLTACFTLAAYAFWRWLRKPTWARSALAGLALGAALTAKFSALLLLPGLAAMALLEREHARGRIVRGSAIVGLVAALAIWAVYGFELGPLAGGRVGVPAPTFLHGIAALAGEVRAGMPAFLLGEYSTVGFWYYFPVAFAVKTPIPLFLLLGVSLVRGGAHASLRRDLAVLAPAAIYFALTPASRMNLGYRHLLPVLPLLFVFVSRIARTGWRKRPGVAGLAGVAVVWLAVASAATFPHYLAYFNEAAAARRHEILVDSNVDWGQDLPGLRRYMERERLSSIRLSYFGIAPPEAYGVVYEPLPSFPRHNQVTESRRAELRDPPPGAYAISVTNLQGLPFADRELYAWFRAREPDADIGHSILVYRVGAR